MADEPKIDPAPDPAPASVPDPLAELRSILDSQATQIRALTDVVQSALTARPVTPSAEGYTGSVTPQLRQALRQKGHSDADIDRNAPLILPYIEIFAPELIGLVESRVGPVAETVTLSEMAQDTDTYPYAKGLRAEIRKVIADAKKEGRALSPEAAYHTAVSMDVAAGEKSKVRGIDAERRANSPGADASALGSLGHRTSSGTGARAAKPATPRTAEDLKSMPYEDRLKWYETNGDVPVQ